MLSYCNNCPHRGSCRPEEVIVSTHILQRLRRTILNAPRINIPGFGRPLAALATEQARKQGINQNEYARAVVISLRAQGKEGKYLIWTDPDLNTHVTPVDTKEKVVYEKGTQEYWKLHYTPIATLTHNPHHLRVTKITQEQANTLPVIKPDSTMIEVADLGYGKIKDDPPRLDTGIAYVYRVRVCEAFGWLVQFRYNTDPVLVAREPLRFLAHASKAIGEHHGPDAFRGPG